MAEDPVQILEKLTRPQLVFDFANRLKSEFLSLVKNEGTWLEVFDITNDDITGMVAEADRKLDECMQKSRSPLRVSLIGPFSSGKTVTLCALLNKPRLLASATVPTTGNVVEIQIVPPGSNTNTRQMHCILFTVPELEAMLRDYYAWMQRKQEKVKLAGLPTKDGFLPEKISLLRTDVKEQLVDTWVQQKKNPAMISYRLLKRLAHLYFILVTIDRYFDYQKKNNVPALDAFVLPYDPANNRCQLLLTAVTILDMEWSADMLHPENLEEMVSDFWQQVPSRIETFYQQLQTGTVTEKAVRAFLPLYKRIVLTEEMNLPGGWGEVERVSFLDFPGLDSGSRRDLYLCLKELDSAHSNMLFFLANRPTVDHAQDLIEIIAEAKSQSLQLSDRMIPVVNFFDAYEDSPEYPEQAAGIDESIEKIVNRVDRFFAREEVAGVRRGFDVFERILSFLNLTGNWGYHLLAPIAAIDQDTLTKSEAGYRKNFEEDKGRYGQLIKDLRLARRELAKNPGVNQEKIKKYRRLQTALEAYHHDGGIAYLREVLGNMLRKKGAWLIAEDARVPLNQALATLANFIRRLEIEAVDTGDPDLEDKIARAQTRAEIIELWKKMELVLLEWTRRNDLVTVQYQAPASSSTNTGEYQSPLAASETRVLQRVLSDTFWDELNRPVAEIKEISLSVLAEKYWKMVEELRQWSEGAIEQTITTTLDRLENTVLPLETGEKTSLIQLRERLFSEFVRDDVVTPEDKAHLKELFSLTSIHSELYRRLKELHKKEMEHQETISRSSANKKAPFNEKLIFNWSPFEVIKIQRQVILTLQRQVTGYFSFYLANFFNEFRHILKERLDNADNSMHRYYQIFSQPGNLFDQMASISRQRDKDSTDLNRTEKLARAQEAVAKILSCWKSFRT